MKTNKIPFGEIEQDRFEICIKYKLLEKVSDIWRMTTKARSNYEPISFVNYLKGTVEKPDRLSDNSYLARAKIPLSPEEELKTPEVQTLLDELLGL